MNNSDGHNSDGLQEAELAFFFSLPIYNNSLTKLVIFSSISLSLSPFEYQSADKVQFHETRDSLPLKDSRFSRPYSVHA